MEARKLFSEGSYYIVIQSTAHTVFCTRALYHKVNNSLFLLRPIKEVSLHHKSASLFTHRPLSLFLLFRKLSKLSASLPSFSLSYGHSSACSYNLELQQKDWCETASRLRYPAQSTSTPKHRFVHPPADCEASDT